MYVEASASPDDSLLQLVAQAALKAARATHALGMSPLDFGVFQVDGRLIVRVAPWPRWGDFGRGMHLLSGDLMACGVDPDGMRQLLARYALTDTLVGFFGFGVTAAELSSRASILHHLLTDQPGAPGTVGNVGNVGNVEP